MENLVAIFVFCFGVAIGSFLNVVIYRYNTGKGINGRSQCMNCGKTLGWYELVPVFSFLIQGGKCRKCSSKLSWQYPAVEFLTGLLFLATFYSFAWEPRVFQTLIQAVIALVVWCLLVVIFVYDLKHKIIPDGLVYSFAVLGLLHIFLIPNPSNLFVRAGNSELLINLLAGPILFLPFFLLWFFSGGRWIGLGDGKLALGIGWMLGLAYGTSAVFLAFWIGAALALGTMLVFRLKSNRSGLTMKSEIPFAPFLILGFTIVYFWPIDLIGLRMMLGEY